MAKPVIYLREFYADEVMHAYFKVMVRPFCDERYSQLFQAYGPAGCGKTTFIRHFLFGLHSNRKVIFLTSSTVLEAAEWMEEELADHRDQVLVYDAGAGDSNTGTLVHRRLWRWVKRYKGLKALFISRQLQKSFKTSPAQPGQYVLLPEFNRLDAGKANLFFSKLGIPPIATVSLSHAEIFAIARERDPVMSLLLQ